MRAVTIISVRLILFATLGGFIMADGTATVTADDKKADATEKISLRIWDEQAKKLRKEREVDARRQDGKDGIVYFFIPNKQAIEIISKGSEITDGKGDVWVSQRNCNPGNGGETQVPAKKKP